MFNTNVVVNKKKIVAAHFAGDAGSCSSAGDAVMPAQFREGFYILGTTSRNYPKAPEYFPYQLLG